jgi:phosphatidylserine/phosphatidylglycerophosphate/cardiolipin synthase-like enzyme
MRVRNQNGAISVQAVAGSYVVLLGMDATPEAAKGLLGFAIYRTDHTENEHYWLKGFKTFEATYPHPPVGMLVSTHEHPIQSFLWGDYTAKPDHQYTYQITPMYGQPKALKPGQPVSVQVNTESEDSGEHAVFFNRGVGGSQAYARRFNNQPPNKVPDRQAYIWLSRGLEEAMLKFIRQAKGKRYSLRAAVYEFSYVPVLKAFAEAAKKGADVKIVYDARENQSGPKKTSDEAIRKTYLRKLMIPRTQNPSYIAHNKFIVLLKDGHPIQVWTSSTNFTEGGIFGQSNVGHIVRDPQVAQIYLDYWERLAQDPDAGNLRRENLLATPDLTAVPPASGITPIFSPRTMLTMLDWYVRALDSAQHSVCFTAAFGINAKFDAVLEQEKGYLRYLLLEKPGKSVEGSLDYRANPDNRFAIGSLIQNDGLGRWVTERLTGLNKNVKYIHTKYMLIDPLGDDPVVISGSANFSTASTKNNDENMLIIRGNQRAADIYLGEFMRLFNHYYFRSYQQRQQAQPGSTLYQSIYLDPDDSWTHAYYQPGSNREKERLLFR